MRLSVRPSHFWGWKMRRDENNHKTHKKLSRTNKKRKSTQSILEALIKHSPNYLHRFNFLFVCVTNVSCRKLFKANDEASQRTSKLQTTLLCSRFFYVSIKLFFAELFEAFEKIKKCGTESLSRYNFPLCRFQSYQHGRRLRNVFVASSSL